MMGSSLIGAQSAPLSSAHGLRKTWQEEKQLSSVVHCDCRDPDELVRDGDMVMHGHCSKHSLGSRGDRAIMHA